MRFFLYFLEKSESSSDFDDSPIKRKGSKEQTSNSKRRKLVIESSDESDADASKKKTATPKKKAKTGDSPKPKENKTSKAEKKEVTNEVKEEKKNEKKEEEAKKENLTSPKAPPKTKKEPKSPKQIEKPAEVETIETKPVEVKTEPITKPTPALSNFFNLKKSEESIKTSTAASSGTQFEPDKSNYHPIDDACWQKDQPVPYKALAQTLYCMEKTTKRLELLSIVSNYFRSVLLLTPKDLIPSVFILTNKVAPDYDSLELGIGDTVLFKALAEATGCTVAKLKTEFQNKGDIGLVAEANRCNQKLIFTPKKLTVAAVFAKLKEIASISGNSSQAKKCDMIKGLLVSCDSVEARYLMRSLAGKMRNGLGELSILNALAHACATSPPRLNAEDKLVIDKFAKMRLKEPDEMKAVLEEAVQKVRHAYHQCPNYEHVINAIITHGLEKLEEHCRITPGVPVKPMLAYPTKGIHEVLKRFDQIEFTCEYKYDGERAQIHILNDGSVQVYSRNSENNTTKYPDVADTLSEILSLKSKERQVKSAILDAEVVAYDIEKKLIQPFQVLSTRKRKDVNAADIKIQVCIFAFDLMYLNDESLIDLAFWDRRQRLYDYFPCTQGKLMYAEHMDMNDLESIQEFLDKSIKDGCEGLMIKTLKTEAHYEISKRSHNWLKLKKDYLEGVGDTLDLVCIGGYLGTGKRTGVYGGYLLACYDPENEEYQTICKLGTGLKDDDLKNQFEALSKIKIDAPKTYYRVDSTLEQPDHWFEPEKVWEIKCADLSLSPVHTAAIGLIEDSKGVSLRFPRYLRERDDKKAEDATTAEQVVDMYKNQQQMVMQNETNSKKAGKNSDDEELDE
jgi:DNA ligase-1